MPPSTNICCCCCSLHPLSFPARLSAHPLLTRPPRPRLAQRNVIVVKHSSALPTAEPMKWVVSSDDSDYSMKAIADTKALMSVRSTGLAQLVRIGPALRPRIPIGGLNRSTIRAQPCAICVTKEGDTLTILFVTVRAPRGAVTRPQRSPQKIGCVRRVCMGAQGA